MNLTVATVVLNAADDLPLTLESVIGQDYDDIELLVVDGASWDRTPEVLNLYAQDIDRLETVEDGGIFDAMNRAAEFASGEMILFLNAGDVFHSANSISKLMARRRPSADIVYGNHIYRYHGLEEFRPSWDFRMAMEALKRGAISSQWLERFPAHQATMTRTALLRQLRYDGAFRVCGDHDFFLRAIDSGVQTQFIDELVSIYAGGGFSVQRHDLLKVEWNALHRRFSAEPEAIDHWYFGGRSPFEGTRAPFSGDAIAGLHSRQAADLGRGIHHPFRWLSGDGARLVTPSNARSSGLFLRGTNPFARQNLEVMSGRRRLAQATVAPGPFALEIPFHEPATPHTIVELIPEFGERLGDGPHIVALALREFAFRSEVIIKPRPVGTPIHFNKANANENKELIGAGWHDFEPSFIWSRGEVSDLRLASPDAGSALRFNLRPNPSVPGQYVSIAINGHSVIEVAPGPDVAVPVADAWNGNGRDNFVTVKASGTAKVGDDPRDLGVALVTVTLI